MAPVLSTGILGFGIKVTHHRADILKNTASVVVCFKETKISAGK